jgi:hypothetical protein
LTGKRKSPITVLNKAAQPKQKEHTMPTNPLFRRISQVPSNGALVTLTQDFDGEKLMTNGRRTLGMLAMTGATDTTIDVGFVPTDGHAILLRMDIGAVVREVMKNPTMRAAIAQEGARLSALVSLVAAAATPAPIVVAAATPAVAVLPAPTPEPVVAALPTPAAAVVEALTMSDADLQRAMDASNVTAEPTSAPAAQ